MGRHLSFQHGVAAIEFALLLPLLLVLTFGATEFGRAIYTYNTLDKTVRDAVRHLSQHGPGEVVVQDEARCLAVFGNADCSGAPVAPGLTVANVQLCDSLSCADHLSVATGAGVMNMVTVRIVNYAYTSAVTWVMPSLTFGNISASMRAQL